MGPNLLLEVPFIGLNRQRHCPGRYRTSAAATWT
jgi:hypothetical protein